MDRHMSTLINNPLYWNIYTVVFIKLFPEQRGSLSVEFHVNKEAFIYLPLEGFHTIWWKQVCQRGIRQPKTSIGVPEKQTQYDAGNNNVMSSHKYSFKVLSVIQSFPSYLTSNIEC